MSLFPESFGRVRRLRFWRLGRNGASSLRFPCPIEVTQIILQKAEQPDIVVDFLDADGLAGEDRPEVNFFLAEKWLMDNRRSR
jgi:hypothetical protein